MTKNQEKKMKALEKSFNYCLKDFRSDKDALAGSRYDTGITWRKIDIDRSISPLPYMVFVCLVVIQDFDYWGQGEKVLWEIPIKYKSYSFNLALRKFGLSLACRDDYPPESMVMEMLKQLDKAIRISDKLLQPYAQNQVKNGNVTMANRYIRLNMRYQFFRKKSKEIYSRIDKKQKAMKKGADFHSVTKMISYKNKSEREAAYYTIAMLDSYFSRLEHLLVLILPFLGFDHTKDNLVQLMSSTWSYKYKRVFKLRDDKKAKNLYERLASVKEKYRNTITHGDFEKGGASLYFHLIEFGAIPVRMSGFKDSIYYSFLPITLDSYKQICDLLDEVDDLLITGKTKYGVMFAKSGLDVAFDEKSLSAYSKAMKSDDKFKSLIEEISYEDNKFTNMDF